jgi:hypothetical protein
VWVVTTVAIIRVPPFLSTLNKHSLQVGGMLHAPLVGEIVVGLLLGPEGAGFLLYPEAIVLARTRRGRG